MFQNKHCFKKVLYIFFLVLPQIGIEPRDSEASVGEKIRLSCEAIGRPTPNITWNFNG